MGIKQWMAALAMAVGMGTVHAAPVQYSGTLGSGAPVTGTVGGFSYFLDQGALVNYWRIAAVAGATISLSASRLNGNLDPMLGLWFGTTSADTSAFIDGIDWGGMTFIGGLDDEHAPALPGPNGDPFGSFIAPFTGIYTIIIGGGLSTDTGPYAYSLTATAIPEPATFGLLAAGVLGAGLSRRRVRRSTT